MRALSAGRLSARKLNLNAYDMTRRRRALALELPSRSARRSDLITQLFEGPVESSD